VNYEVQFVSVGDVGLDRFRLNCGDGFRLTDGCQFTGEIIAYKLGKSGIRCVMMQMQTRGPTGEIVYNGNELFTISGHEHRFDKVNLVLGGSGITPGYSLIARAMLSSSDKTEIRVVDANKSEKDILLRDELDRFEDAW
jgi:NAD(P)H-flavin reductase